ncbi:MAG: RNA polymerase sigma-70 factor [Muribaculaceae bacterium]|nr:RNA polymerase sigma-70 factor [Muribaculaceae bacterium]
MAKEHPQTDIMLMAALKMDSHEAFVEIFRLYYTGLVAFCGQFIDDRDSCEDIVQDVFVKIWGERRQLEIRRSLKSYLTALVQNRALDELRHNKVKAHYATGNHARILSLSPEEHLFYSNLSEALDHAIEKLAAPVRETLRLNLYERQTYPQIAKTLGVSVRTVEARMSKALKHIRESLKDFRTPLLAAVPILEHIFNTIGL